MTKAELIKKLKEIDYSDGEYPCNNKYKYIRNLVSTYEAGTPIESLEACFKDFVSWDYVKQEIKRLIDERDTERCYRYMEGISLDSDVYWLNIEGFPEHVNRCVIECLIRNILNALETTRFLVSYKNIEYGNIVVEALTADKAKEIVENMWENGEFLDTYSAKFKIQNVQETKE